MTSAGLRTCVVPGEDIEIASEETSQRRDSFGSYKIYGGGLLVAPVVVERLREARIRREEERRVLLTPTPEEAAQLRVLAEMD